MDSASWCLAIFFVDVKSLNSQEEVMLVFKKEKKITAHESKKEKKRKEIKTEQSGLFRCKEYSIESHVLWPPRKTLNKAQWRASTTQRITFDDSGTVQRKESCLIVVSQDNVKNHV